MKESNYLDNGSLPATEKMYFCPMCQKWHRIFSKIGRDHVSTPHTFILVDRTRKKLGYPSLGEVYRNLEESKRES